MEQHFVIRRAAAGDAAALLDIYAPYIRDTAITFEYDVPAAEEFAARIGDITRTHPYLVCERDGRPVGYAYAHRIRERAAYDWAAELSVYLAPAAQGQGAGTALYRCLIDLLAMQNLRILYGCVTLPNEKSRAPARKAGLFARGRVARRGLEIRPLARRRLAGKTARRGRGGAARHPLPAAGRTKNTGMPGPIYGNAEQWRTELTWHFATF